MMRLLGNNTGMVVLYANNDELLSFYNNSKLNPEDLEKIRNKSFMNSDEYQSIFSTTILLAPAANLGKEWTILKGSTPKGWTLVLLLKDLFSQRFRSQLILIILMFSILMLGMILILKIAVKNYTPVLSLREKVSNIFTYEDDIGDNYSNDYDYIESCIMMIINEKECLKSSLNTHLAKAYDFLIFNLLNGKIDKVENFNKYAASFDIQLQQDYYYIVFVLLSNIKNVKTDSSFIKTSKKNSEVCKGIVEEAFKQSGKFTILTRTLSISDGITIIASFDKKHTELFYGILQDLPLKLNQSVASPYVIGVGDICNAIKGIPRSYINALFACNNIFFKNEKIIHLYNENITTTPGSLNLDAYRKALQKGNTSEILNKLSGIQAIIKSQDMNLSNTFITVYHVLKIFIQESQRFISDFSRIDSPTSFLIIDCCSIPSFLLSIEAMKRFIYNGLMANIYYDEILEPIEQIRLYISHNYDNPNFSIKDVAQHFHMSVPTLSNYYKKETNETLIEFITSLKIEKAIQLLKNSNMSINDIAMAVGYYNTNSFIRRFRQVMHITPGEFRNIEVRDPIS
jgi:two-component system response regulator YesN